MANQSLKETPKTQSNPQTQVQGQNQQPKPLKNSKIDN